MSHLSVKSYHYFNRGLALIQPGLNKLPSYLELALINLLKTQRRVVLDRAEKDQSVEI